MNLLYDIYKKLKKREKRRIKLLIRASPFAFEKLSKLYDLVTQYDEQEEDFYAQKLYGKPADNTFRVTKSRLKRVFENVIVTDKSLADFQSDASRNRLQVRKKLLQVEVLWGRGAYHAGRNLLHQVQSTCRRYALHEEAFQANLLHYRFQYTRQRPKKFVAYTEELLRQNSHRAQIDEALIQHYYIANFLANRTPRNDEKDDLHQRLHRISEIAELTDHPLVHNVHALSATYFHLATHKYEIAHFWAERYLDSVQNEPSQRTTARLGNAWVQLGQIALQLGQPEAASEAAERAREHFPEKDLNHLLTLELSFRIAFFEKDHAKADEIVQQAMQHRLFGNSVQIAAKWYYFKACVLFRQEAYRKSYFALNETRPLLADKEGMNVYIRLLEIMIQYEMGHIDLLDTKIQNIRQFARRGRKQSANERTYLLVRLLLKWKNHAYLSDETVAKSAAVLQKLKNLESQEPFDTSGAELVRFDHWLLEQARPTPND